VGRGTNRSRAFRGFKVGGQGTPKYPSSEVPISGERDESAETSASPRIYRARNTVLRPKLSRGDWDEIAKLKEFYQEFLAEN